jgi:hypothetical protein
MKIRMTRDSNFDVTKPHDSHKVDILSRLVPISNWETFISTEVNNITFKKKPHSELSAANRRKGSFDAPPVRPLSGARR